MYRCQDYLAKLNEFLTVAIWRGFSVFATASGWGNFLFDFYLFPGSCLGNPGPCGTGACIYMPGYTDPTIHKQPVTSCGSILLGELIAIKMVINEIQNQAEKRELNNVKKVHIFSDSQCAIGHLSLGWEAKMHRASIYLIYLIYLCRHLIRPIGLF